MNGRSPGTKRGRKATLGEEGFRFPAAHSLGKDNGVCRPNSPTPSGRTDIRGLAYHENVLGGRCRAPVVR